MTRVYLADAHLEERSALCLLLLDLKMEVVGEAADWSTILVQAPTTCLDILLVEMDVLPIEASAALSELRLACPNAIRVVLLSQLDARQQAALSSTADAFINKSETPDRVSEHLRAAALT